LVSCITVSTRAASQGYGLDAQGKAVDLSGDAMLAYLEAKNNEFQVAGPVQIVKDDVDEIKKAVLKVKDESDLIILSGGTGFTPDDVTPEAIESLIVQ